MDSKTIFLWCLWIGGGFYFLHKFFSWWMEKEWWPKEQPQSDNFWHYRQLAFGSYLAGLPFIVIFFFLQRNWVFGWLEIGGLPAMLAALIEARRREENPPKRLSWLVLALTAFAVGLGFSLYDFGGISLRSEVEIVGGLCFLMATILQYLGQPSCYSWYLAMNVATGVLMLLQDQKVMFAQQVLSILFVLAARNEHQTKQRRIDFLESFDGGKETLDGRE